MVLERKVLDVKTSRFQHFLNNKKCKALRACHAWCQQHGHLLLASFTTSARVPFECNCFVRRRFEEECRFVIVKDIIQFVSYHMLFKLEVLLIFNNFFVDLTPLPAHSLEHKGMSVFKRCKTAFWCHKQISIHSEGIAPCLHTDKWSTQRQLLVTCSSNPPQQCFLQLCAGCGS